jgi:hypothetical protein
MYFTAMTIQTSLNEVTETVQIPADGRHPAFHSGIFDGDICTVASSGLTAGISPKNDGLAINIFAAAAALSQPSNESASRNLIRALELDSSRCIPGLSHLHFTRPIQPLVLSHGSSALLVAAKLQHLIRLEWSILYFYVFLL